MPFKKIKDFQIYYEVHGDGEVILLMHHGFGSSKTWKTIYPQFVAQGYKVVMYDRRGFGRSERGDDFKDYYENDSYRADSVEELRTVKEILGIGECHLVGQCEAGVIGVDYAVKYPREVKTLTLASTQCFSEITMAELIPLKFKSRFEDLHPEHQAKLVDWHGEYAAINYEQFAKYGGEYGIGYFDLRPILPLVTCPTLVLYPDRSAIFDVEQSVAFYRGLPRGELAVFPKCGHNTYEQRPDDYMRTLLDFVRRSMEETDPKAGPAMTCLA